MNNSEKTLEEHREYLHKIVRLKLFFLHLWLEKHPEEEFRYVLRERVDIYRKTEANPLGRNPPIEKICWDQGDWKRMEDEAECIYFRFRHDRSSFEEKAFEVFCPSIDARCRRDFSDHASLAQYPAGSSLNIGGLMQNGACFFHIANAVAPHSIFEDPAYLPKCFLGLLDRVEERYHADRICTRTWLNSHPRWQALFPEEWKRNMGPAVKDIRWHYGFWGQFITCRGTFHEKNAAWLRKTGEFPFAYRAAECSVSAMRSHLASLMKNIQQKNAGPDC